MRGKRLDIRKGITHAALRVEQAKLAHTRRVDKREAVFKHEHLSRGRRVSALAVLFADVPSPHKLRPREPVHKR